MGSSNPCPMQDLKILVFGTHQWQDQERQFVRQQCLPTLHSSFKVPVLSFCFLWFLKFPQHLQMYQSLQSSLRACCPTSKACLSPMSPPPCRLVYFCASALETHRMTFPPSMCVESQLFLSVWHWQNSRAVYEMVKWASLPRGTFLLQTPTIDLFCLLIFIASQDGTTALPVSCISYSLSFSPWLSFALPHPWTLFLCLIYKSTHSVSLPLSLSYLSPPLCHLPSLSVRCCVLCVSVLCISDGWPFLVWRLLSLLSTWAALHVQCILYLVLSSPGRKMSRPFFLLLLYLFCVS